VWGRDRFFLGGKWARHRLPGLDAGHGGLEATERSFPEDSLLPAAYRVPLPKGLYLVTLYFCEATSRTPGMRRFDVLLEGKKALTGHEPLAAGFGVLDRRSIETRVDDGALDIEFVRKAGDPMVSAIEIEGRN
jgi:malectin (di-glucose binding ER protein)